MKTLNKYLKVVALFFATLILLQGCTVYKTASVTLYEASKINNKVRVEKKDGKKVKYSNIVLLDDGQYYGKEKVKGTNMYNYILIDEANILKVQFLDKKTSTILNIAVPFVIVGIIIGITAHRMNNTNFFSPM